MAGSRYVSHVKWWFFIAPVFALVLLPFIPDPSLFAIPSAEQNSVLTVLGADRSDQAVIDTNATFRRLFVDDGIVAVTLRGHEGTFLDGGIGELMRKWTRNFWRMIYRMVYRAIVARSWLLGGTIFIAGAVVDGSVRRAIRASAAGVTTPLTFHLASHAIVLIVGGLLVSFVAPFPLLAFYWIGVAAVLGFLVWRATSDF